MARLSAKKVREDIEVEVDLGDGQTVLARKLDLMALMFEGLMPMPMLNAAKELARAKADGADDQAALEAVTEDERKQIAELLRRHACTAVIDPVVVERDDGNPDHLPADMLTLAQLMLIWQATTIIPVKETADAAKFRGDTAEPVPAAVHPRKTVRAAAQRVVEVERKHA